MSSKQSLFYRFQLKQTETQSVLVVFRFVSQNQKKKFGFVSVFRTGIKTTKTNRTFTKQTEKISKKHSLVRCPRNSYCFFGLNRNTQKLNLFRFFSLFFCETNKNCGLFWFVSVFRISIGTAKTNRIDGMGN